MISRAFFVTLGVILTLAPIPVEAFEEAYLPIDHWAYPILERLQARTGRQTVDLAVRPITRGDGVRAMREIRQAYTDGRVALTGIELRQLGLLEREFAPETWDPAGPRYHSRHWIAHDLTAEWSLPISLRYTAEPDSFHDGTASPGDGKSFTDGARTPELLNSGDLTIGPSITLRYGQHALLQQSLDYRLRIGDDVGVGHWDVASGEAEFVHDDDDWVAVKRTTDTMVRAMFGAVAFELGRTPIRWGPGREGSLLISDAAPPMDFLRFIASMGRLHFTNLAAELRTSVPGADKWLAAHRLAYVAPTFTIGVSDVVVFGERAFDFAYLNPFQLFYIVEANVGDRDNNLVGFDVRIIPHPGWELYGELVADDSNIRDGWNYFGNKNAFQLGVEKSGLPGLPVTDVRVEWSLVDQFTYTHVRPINQASHYDRPLGHVIGTDADLFTAVFRHWVSARTEFHAGYEQERHGQGDITISQDERENDRRNYLWGTVESTRRALFGFSYHSVRGLEFGGEYEQEWIANHENAAGARAVTRSRGGAWLGIVF